MRHIETILFALCIAIVVVYFSTASYRQCPESMSGICVCSLVTVEMQLLDKN